jgi:glycosyltransferase involved in cell wall biosynthesis
MIDPLRIAMVAACPFPWPRGTPIRIERIADAVARRGHAVHVVTYHLGQDPGNAPYAVHRIRDVPGYRRTDPGPTLRKLFQLDPMLAGLLRQLHDEIHFDLVHAHHYEGLLVGSHALRGTPIVYDAHTLLASELPTYPLHLPRGWVRAAAPWLDSLLPRRADRIIAVSETIRETLVTGGAVAPSHLQVIPNGVEWQRFAGTERRTPDGRTIIFTGNLAPYQGVELMLEAFARLRARRADARLMIVTDSPFGSFEALARRLGVRDDLDLRQAPFPEQPALLARATVAINPRVRCDGIPQKLLNYMAAGVPIATFESSAGPVRHEVTGLRVPDGDTAAMAGAMERLLTDRVLARRVGDAAREQARREFSWDQVAARVEQVYREAIAEASPVAPFRHHPGRSDGSVSPVRNAAR